MNNIMHNNYDIRNWDWETYSKTVNISSWQEIGIEEIQVSPDGEKIAAIVKVGEKFKIYSNNKICDDRDFNKIWNLKFTENGILYACVMTDDSWTVVVEKNIWEEEYDYVWNLLSSSNKNNFSIAAAVQKNTKYCMVLDGKNWPEYFDAITYCNLSPSGSKTVAVVQTESHNSGDVSKFKEKIYTVAVNGVPWGTKFLNVWGISISEDDSSVAAEVRLNQNTYSIAVDDIIWSKTYSCVWQPIFHPKKKLITAPVRIGSKWGMAVNESIVWDTKFHQVWHQKYDSCGINLAAIVSPQYGRWTIAINGTKWNSSFDSMITDLTFSKDGSRLAALAKHKDNWYIIVDDFVWDHKFDMVWPPVFSQDGKNIASKVEIDGKYGFIINGKLYNDYFDQAWNPKFNLKGDKLLLRVLKKNIYERLVIVVNQH